MSGRLVEPAPKKRQAPADPEGLEAFARLLVQALTKASRPGFADGGQVSKEELRVPGFLETLVGPSGDDNDILDDIKSGVGRGGGAALEAGLGKTYQELVAESRDMFPDTPEGSKHHRLAAQIAGERFGFLPTQLLGAGLEGVELFTGNDTFGSKLQDTKDDLIANLKGGFEGSIPGQLLAKFKQSQSGTGEITKPRASTSIRGAEGGRAHFAAGGTVLPDGSIKTNDGRIVSGNQAGDYLRSTSQRQVAQPNARMGIIPNPSPRQTNSGGPAAIGGRGSGAVDAAAGPGALNGTPGDQNGFINALSGFQPGGNQQLATLAAQDPFGTGRSTQEEQLAGGFRTDVSGATDAARILGGQEFDQAQDQIGERLSALGLTSSSARTAQVAREKGRLGERIAATGLQAGIAADEAAANRRAGAVQNSLGAGNIISSNNQAGLRGAIDQSGQKLGAATAAAGANQNFINSNNSLELGRESNAINRLGTENAFTLGSRGLDQSAEQLGTSDIPDAAQPKLPYRGGGSSVFRTNVGVARAEGGKIPTRAQFEQFLETIGQDLSQGGLNVTGLSAGAMDDKSRAVRRNQALAAFGGEQDAFKLFMDPDAQAALRNDAQNFMGRSGPTGTPSRGSLNMGQLMALGYGRKYAPARIGGDMDAESKGLLGVDPTAFVGTDLDLERAGRGTGDLTGPQFLSKKGREYQAALNAPPAADPRSDYRVGTGLQGRPRQYGAGGGVPQPELPQEGGIQVPGILDPRRQFYEEGGGVAPGQDTGEDQIPAMLRSEELVVTPELVEELEAADPRIPQPQLIAALQQLAQKPMEFSPEAGEHVAASGGVAPGPQFGFAGQQFNLPSIPGISGGVPQGLRELFDLIASNKNAPLDPNAGEVPDVPSPYGQSRDGQTVIPGQVPDPFASDGSAAALGFPEPTQSRYTGPNSFSESVGKAGERSFQLTGSPGIKSGKGTVSNDPTIRLDDGTALKDTFDVPTRLEEAQRRADLVRAAINADPIGGPEKQARLLNTLQSADREVEAATNEIIAARELDIRNKAANAELVSAQANLNSSVAAGLQAQANKATAESALAKQLMEAAAIDPAVAQLLNIFEVQANLAKADPRIGAQLEAVMRRHLEAMGIQLVEHGSIMQLFGAPEFELQPTQTAPGEVDQFGNVKGGMPDPALQSLTPEQLDVLNRFGAGM